MTQEQVQSDKQATNVQDRNAKIDKLTTEQRRVAFDMLFKKFDTEKMEFWVALDQALDLALLPESEISPYPPQK